MLIYKFSLLAGENVWANKQPAWLLLDRYRHHHQGTFLPLNRLPPGVICGEYTANEICHEQATTTVRAIKPVNLWWAYTPSKCGKHVRRMDGINVPSIA